MKRDISFRAWDKLSKKMVDSYFVDAGGDWGHDYDYGDIYEEDHDFVQMQFTGLRDKNGKEIYEGDIVKYGQDKKQAEVIFDDGQFGINDITNNCIEFGALIECSYGWKLEVIGNIYENPELVNIKEDKS